MRPFNVKLWCCIAFLAGLMIINGCGDSGDPIDELGYRYQISVATPKDRNTATSDIDVWRDCDNNYANGDDDEDALTKAAVTLTFISNTDQLDIWVYRIKIDYSLIESTGSPADTPAIASNTFDVDIFIPGDDGSSSQDVDLLTLTDKSAYRTLLGLNDAGLQTRAIFQVTLTAYLTFTPDDPDNDIEIKKHFTINVQNFEDQSCTATTT